MGKINVLGFDVANLIAAGEVVDRPSSVVKELLENSIDAGSTVITVEIQRGGVAFIRVSDNGHGMEPEDLPVSILRHATSKIGCADDLSAIATLGFRGEALAAISSVSRIRIFSRPAGSPMGAILTAEGGEVLDITETGCAFGTTIVVEDLFFNVPARRKFLKRDNTEAAAVSAVVEKIALSRPDISVKYISDGDVRFATPGDGKLYSAIYAVFGKDVATRCLEVSRSADGISVTGYISEPDNYKSNRNMENFFVNGRYVRSKTAMAALEQAFKTRIPPDKFPICVLNIDINPAAVDVNVHPAKLEIKFTNERLIFDAVYYAVINTLESAVIRPELTIGKTKPSGGGVTPPDMGTNPYYKAPVERKPVSTTVVTKEGTVIENAERPEEKPKRRTDSSFWIDGAEARRLLGAFVPADVSSPKPEQVKISTNTVEEEKFPTEKKENFTAPAEKAPSEEVPAEKASVEDVTAAAAKPVQTDTPKTAAEEVPEYIILGEAYNCYVIVQMEDRLLFVDKHAAHERIIFDELCRRMKAAEFSGQLLLAPLETELLEIEADAIREYEEKVRALGFEFTLEARGAGVKVSITAIPEILTVKEAGELFSTLASRLSDVGGGLDAAAEEFFTARLFQSACKAAVKGGRIYDMAHIKWICDRLFVKGENGSVIRTCPHGRPVAFEVKKSSIDRQFARLG
ncbi:MAG: DNA mismatch repair endonuclease MutL [Clostridia bacterium]|nr:DNA mismatch repair endonuclease MutL [Clostridia bacterium]